MTIATASALLSSIYVVGGPQTRSTPPVNKTHAPPLVPKYPIERTTTQISHRNSSFVRNSIGMRNMINDVFTNDSHLSYDSNGNNAYIVVTPVHAMNKNSVVLSAVNGGRRRFELNSALTSVTSAMINA